MKEEVDGISSRAREVPLGELISSLYQEFLVIYGDEELASLAVAATINELLKERTTEHFNVLSQES